MTLGGVTFTARKVGDRVWETESNTGVVNVWHEQISGRLQCSYGYLPSDDPDRAEWRLRAMAAIEAKR